MFKSILGNTMSTIASDLQEASEGTLDAEMLAESSLDMVEMYGDDLEAVKEFQKLDFKEQMEIATKVAKYYV